MIDLYKELKVLEPSSNQPSRYYVAMDRGNGRDFDIIAEVGCGGADEAKARALLMAAAPVMMAALEAVVACHKRHRWKVNSDEVDPIKRAVAALAIAKGTK